MLTPSPFRNDRRDWFRHNDGRWGLVRLATPPVGREGVRPNRKKRVVLVYAATFDVMRRAMSTNRSPSLTSNPTATETFSIAPR
jgi:hypothetical protein